MNYKLNWKLKIGNWKLRVRGGFTLMEILISTILIATAGFIASATLLNILKGAAKTEVIKEVNQNGDYAISVFERMVRDARDITSLCDGTTSDSLTILSLSDEEITLSCAENEGSAQIASASASYTGYLTNTEVTLGESCPGTLLFTCIDSYDSPKVVSMEFTLRQKTVGVPISEQASSSFKTSISLRNK